MRAFVLTLIALALLAAGLYAYLRDKPHAPPSQSAGNDAPAATAATPAPGAEDPLDEEAREYIRDLTALKDNPLAADSADNFVQRDQSIRLLPERKTEQLTPRQLLADPSTTPDTPFTIVKEAERIEILTPDKLRETGADDPDRPIRILSGETIEETTVGAVLERNTSTPDVPISVIKKVEEVQVMTAAEIGQDSSLDQNAPLSVRRGRQSLDEATVAELMRNQGQNDADAIYYVRTVKDTDTQGIWGIIQYGLIDNFAHGIAIRRGEDIGTYRVDIPRNADEMLNSRSSSFLGRMIFDKSTDSYIYNLRQGRIGQNPDRIHSGQELLIIRFTPEELVAIYKHFVSSRNS